MPTEKQKTCSHPLSQIVFLPDNITICHHCYGLLDTDFKLIEENAKCLEVGGMDGEEMPPEIVAA